MLRHAVRWLARRNGHIEWWPVAIVAVVVSVIIMLVLYRMGLMRV